MSRDVRADSGGNARAEGCRATDGSTALRTQLHGEGGHREVALDEDVAVIVDEVRYAIGARSTAVMETAIAVLEVGVTERSSHRLSARSDAGRKGSVNGRGSVKPTAFQQRGRSGSASGRQTAPYYRTKELAQRARACRRRGSNLLSTTNLRGATGPRKWRDTDSASFLHRVYRDTGSRSRRFHRDTPR
jgi:hypothetical protein